MMSWLAKILFNDKEPSTLTAIYGKDLCMGNKTFVYSLSLYKVIWSVLSSKKLELY